MAASAPRVATARRAAAGAGVALGLPALSGRRQAVVPSASSAAAAAPASLGQDGARRESALPQQQQPKRQVVAQRRADVLAQPFAQQEQQQQQQRPGLAGWWDRLRESMAVAVRLVVIFAVLVLGLLSNSKPRALRRKIRPVKQYYILQ